MKQSELIKRLSDRELKKQLVISQCLFLILSLVLSIFLFQHPLDWLDLFIFRIDHIFYFGIIAAVFLVIVEIVLYVLLPQRMFDDGGINERIFKGQSIKWIACITMLVAICEEFLFRGVIQTVFGYIFASSIFALVHVRYLRRPVLFILVVATSFLIGFLYHYTENLLVTIIFHFVLDFLLGLFIRTKK